MQYQFVSKILFILFFSILFCSCSNETPSAKTSSLASQRAVKAEGVIAQVGDQVITLNELNTMLNSSAMVGLSIPALGTPRRNQVIYTLLDKVISANLLYLDGKQNGADKLTAYISDMKKFEDAILATMYRSQVLIGDISVSDDEVVAFYNSSISPETELNDDVKVEIEAKIRKQKFTELRESMRERLRTGVEIKINKDLLSAGGRRSDADVVATVAEDRITWSDVKMQMRGADRRATLSEFYIDNDEERLKQLQMYIDNELMSKKALAAGMGESKEFIRRTAEYRKTHLINLYRTALINRWKPSDDELKTYFVANKDQISIPEARKLQMVVVKTEEKAASIKADIESGKITMFQAAQQYSLDPKAKHTLGELGWVSQGTGFDELDDFTFNLEPEAIGGPVKSPAGWQLVKVLDVKDAQLQDFDDPQVSRLTLRLYMKNKFDDYVVDLRKNHFQVAVYEDEINKRFQKEADYIAALSIKAKEQGSITKQRLDDMQKWITPAVE